MGHQREQPARAVLFGHTRGPAAPGGGNRQLGEDRRDGQSPAGGSAMTRLRVLATRVISFLTRGKREAELNEELQAHLDLLADEHQRRGLSPAEARAAARRDFGGVDQIKEVYRDQRGLP